MPATTLSSIAHQLETIHAQRPAQNRASPPPWRTVLADLYDTDGTVIGQVWTRPVPRGETAVQVESPGRRYRMVLIPVSGLVVKQNGRLRRVSLDRLGLDRADGVVVGIESTVPLGEDV